MDNQLSIVSSPSSAESPSTHHPITILAQLTPEEDPVVSDPVVISFEDYINDQSKIKPTDRIYTFYVPVMVLFQTLRLR